VLPVRGRSDRITPWNSAGANTTSNTISRCSTFSVFILTHFMFWKRPKGNA